jgi:hypothetical protein
MILVTDKGEGSGCKAIKGDCNTDDEKENYLYLLKYYIMMSGKQDCNL